MAKKKKEIVPANKPISAAKAQDLVNKGAKKVDPILFTKKGLELIAMYAISNKTTIRGAITGISRKFRDLQTNKSLDKGVLKTTYSKQVAKTTDLPSRIAQLFPQGITSIKRLINEHEAVEQALYSMGILEDADPDLSKLRNEIREKGLDKRSTEGKEKLAILERGGQPAVIGRKKDVARGVMDLDDLVRDEKTVLPYRYKFNKSAVRKIITGSEGRELIGLAESIGGETLIGLTDKTKPKESRAQESARLATEQYEKQQKRGEIPTYTTIGDEDLSTPTQKLQEELKSKKEPVTEQEKVIKDLEAKQIEKDERVKNRTLEFLKKGGLKIGKNALPFFGPVAAAVAAYQSGEATASEVERLIDAAEAGLEAAIVPIDATPVASGELPERLRNNMEALQRAMQPQQ